MSIEHNLVVMIWPWNTISNHTILTMCHAIYLWQNNKLVIIYKSDDIFRTHESLNVRLFVSIKWFQNSNTIYEQFQYIEWQMTNANRIIIIIAFVIRPHNIKNIHMYYVRSQFPQSFAIATNIKWTNISFYDFFISSTPNIAK